MGNLNVYISLYDSLIVTLNQDERPQTHQPELCTACNVVAHIKTVRYSVN